MNESNEIMDCWKSEIYRVFDCGIFAVSRLVNELAKMNGDWATEGLSIIASEYVEGAYKIVYTVYNWDEPAFEAFIELVRIVEKKGWDNVTIKAIERCTNSRNKIVRIEAQLILNNL